MDLDDLRRRLAEHSAGRLAEEIVHLAGRDRAVRRRLELLAMEGDTAGLAAALRRRIAGLKRAKSFVEYRDSFNFARDLEALVDSVRRDLLDTDPESACSVLEAFIEADEAIFERSDDSSGSIGDAFREACRLFLQAAARVESDRDWAGRIYELVRADGYGAREALLKHAADLLSEHELRRLARRFEDDARAAAVAPEQDRYARGTALAHHSLVAEALRDPRLYEQTISTRGGELNDLQRLDVARHYLEYGQPREAERHLRSVRGGDERWSLLADCYEQTGQQAERIDCLWRLFELGLAWEDFEQLSAALPEEDRRAARKRARKTALAAKDTVGAAAFLLQLGCNADAERLVADRRDALEGHFYGRLTQLAKLAAERKAHRIEAFCYRALLENILDEGRSRAYGHAARYLKRLGELDGVVGSYAPAVDHQEYIGWLRDRHGRKRAFWRRVESGRR